MKLLICIPAYNEAATIGALLDSLDDLDIGCERDCAYDVLVINDGSSDETEAVCRAHKGVAVISHIYNLGYGAALKTAYKYAVMQGYDFVIQIDADGQHDTCNIVNIFRLLTSVKNPDIVLGSRYLSDESDFRAPWYKRLVVAGIKAVIRLTTRVHITDPTSGLQGLSRRAFTHYSGFENFDIDYPDANIIIQMLLLGFTVEETAAVMHPREHGTSMHSGIIKPAKYIVKMTLSILGVYLRERKKNRPYKTE